MKHFFAPVLALCFVAVFILSFFKISLSSQRRIYWSCALFGAVSGFLMFLPNWKDGTVAALFALIPMTLFAYGYTPYIKIRGKIYALYLSDSLAEHDETSAAAVPGQEYDPAPDSYGGIATAAKFWWVLVFSMAMSAVLLYAFARGEMDGLGAVIGAGFIVFLAVVGGLGDASWDYPVARGQRLQFGIISVITAGAFTVLYLAAYYAGKRWPLRMKRSLEYRAHPRHRKNYPQ
jgi:hypothetical protein